MNTKEGADPASVVYDGLSAARVRKKNVVIIDTAGRLHTKVNLMSELEKIKRVILSKRRITLHWKYCKPLMLQLDRTLSLKQNHFMNL